MTGNDIPAPTFRPQPRDILVALALLTRLPLPYADFAPNDPRPAAHAAWAYPLVGLVVGALSVLAAFAALSFGLPAGIAALFALLASVLSTGAMHEDGLADCADGFWGGWTKERRLEIMKDSQIGTYGVIALVLSFGLRWGALSALIATGGMMAALLSAAVISRAGMVLVMAYLPPARATGLSHQTGKPPRNAALCAGGLAAAALALLIPAPLFGSISAVAFVMVLTTFIAKAKIGGQTGDVLGATQQLIEITVLLVCLSALP